MKDENGRGFWVSMPYLKIIWWFTKMLSTKAVKIYTSNSRI